MENYLSKDKARAKTRFSIVKKKKECSKYFWLQYIENKTQKDLQKKIGKMCHNPKNCSCWMCGNPRRKYKGRLKGKMTIAEIKELNRFNINDYLKYEV